MHIFLLFLLSHFAWATPELVEGCRKQDLASCEKLGDYYFAKEKWENAYLIGEALCKKDVARSCMIAGSALLAQGKIPEATNLLITACDKFEAYACRSMARLMSKAGNRPLARMYFKRSCHYGLREICGDIRDTDPVLSKAGAVVAGQINTDCLDGQSQVCQAHFKTIETCAKPLTQLDCQLLAGHLSVYFRAKFMQEEAKLLLLSLHGHERTLKENPKRNSYSYDLKLVLTEAKPLEKYHYIFGFMQGCAKKFVRGKGIITNSQELYRKSYKEFGARATANVLEFFEKGKGDDCYDSKHGFEAFAVAALDPLHPTRLDIWKIDQDQRLTHVQNGLPLP